MPNDFNTLVDNVDRALNQFKQNLISYNEMQASVTRELSNSSKTAIENFKRILLDDETELAALADKENKARKQYLDETISLQNKIVDAQNSKLAIERAIADANSENERKYLENKKDNQDKELETLAASLRVSQAKLQGDTQAYEEALQELARKEAIAHKEEQVENDILKKKEKIAESLTRFLSEGMNKLLGTQTDAINKIANIYNQTAGKLSAQLNVSVNDISELQQNIAESLRNTNLNKAISNVAVLSEASSLASAGFTNTDKLSQNATDIVIAQKIAPNLDVNNATVKNLINIFGSDFTSRFAAIQQAVQETAGSTAGMSETVSSLFTSLEPVYMNAEYQQTVMQGTSDVAATISSAIDSGLIDKAQANEYTQAIVELMDPTKALKSNNIAVRSIAASGGYDWSNNDPSVALEAILKSTQSLYSMVGGSDSGSDRFQRAYFAQAMGQDTMSAMYNLKGYTDVNMVKSSDLDTTYDNALNNLEDGKYTTASEAVANRAENREMNQQIAMFAKSFPRTYDMTSKLILAAINTLPQRIATALSNGLGGMLNGGGGGSTNIPGSNSKGGSKTSTKGKFSGLSGGNLKDKFKNADRTSLGAISMYLGGAMSAADIISSNINDDEGYFTEGNGWGSLVGDDNNILGAAIDYAGIGAAAGTALGGFGVGTAIGAAAGGGLGLLFGHLAKEEEKAKAIAENTEAIKKQTEATTNLFGVSEATLMEQKATTAKSGATITLNSGDYYADIPGYAKGMDYVPYDDYLVKLHKGEAVVTANAAKELRKADPNFWSTPKYNSNNDDVVMGLREQTESLVDAIKGKDKFAPMKKMNNKTYTIANAVSV